MDYKELQEEILKDLSQYNVSKCSVTVCDTEETGKMVLITIRIENMTLIVNCKEMGAWSHEHIRVAGDDTDLRKVMLTTLGKGIADNIWLEFDNIKFQ